MQSRLDGFGEELVWQVRDPAIESCTASVSGQHRDVTEAWMAVFDHMDEDQRAAVERLVRWQTDQTIAHLLRRAEISHTFRLTDGRGGDVGEISDGLAGELYGHRGWLAKFARHPSDFGG